MTTRPLVATYRLQLNAQFTLHDARARVPYLQALGISHLYLSPVLAARAGSTHGYDVADPTHVSETLGGDAALIGLANAAHDAGMGIILDIVPNHMGIGADNPYWDNLLMHGAKSRYADWFDVEWHATTKPLAGKVLLPVLGDTLDNVLERDELTLDVSETGARIRYFDHHFPIDPATLTPEIEVAIRDPLARPALGSWSHGAEGRERMRALLAQQHYLLAFWRTAGRDLNYRRFFDVNELIALRVERAPVFDATHATVLRWVESGVIDGLRIDHIDGLLEPRRYLNRLREAVDARRPPEENGTRFPIWVEKILAEGERLPSDWPVDGTTGYEFLVALDDAFIDPDGYAQLEARYRRAGHAGGFRAVALESKRRVLRNGLNADVRRIAPMLASLARAEERKPSVAACAGAIVELTAVLPVYRTYMDAECPVARDGDRAVLERSFAEVRERARADSAAVDLLEHALLGAWGGRDADEASRKRLTFVVRWQQLTGPAAAKGVEDTALYRYAPLASRNEVGGDPGVPVAGALDRLHARLSERATHAPLSLNTTNTHDTKRSADVRGRLNALSEHASDWARRHRHWRLHGKPLRRMVDGKLAPTRVTENFIHQALVGLWPISGAPSRDAAHHGDVDGADARGLADLRERLTAYITKSVREAKVSTSWTDPDAEYEKVVAEYIAALMDRQRNARFLREVEQFVSQVTPQGEWNALARLVVHMTAPGVPDLYQGDELWYQALVDPDNRRPVDWVAREKVLAEVCGQPIESLLRQMEDGRLKMALTAKLLEIRRDDGFMMSSKSYSPLEADGARKDHVLAFERGGAGATLLVVVPRLTSALAAGAEPPIGALWGDTAVRPSAGRWRNLLTGAEHRADRGVLPVRELLATLPVAVLRDVASAG